jgi:hypothetical protein
MNKARYVARRALGGCTYCRGRDSVPNRTMCQDCLDRKKHYRQKQILAGKCFGHPTRDVFPGKKICKECLWRSITYKTGWTEAAYTAAYKKQRGRCALCNKPGLRVMTADKQFVLQGDHCHDSKQTRGLLCTSCNTLLGRFLDNLDLIKLFAQNVEAYFVKYSGIALKSSHSK